MKQANMAISGMRRARKTEVVPETKSTPPMSSHREKRARLSAQIAGLPKPGVGSISVCDGGALQTRVTRAGVTQTGCFTLAHHGFDPVRTYRAALLELERLADEVGPRTGLRYSVSPSKINALPPGVSLGTHYDPRRDYHCFRYQVAWNDGEKQRNKTFIVGRVDIADERDAATIGRIAIAFRIDFEDHFRRGRSFPVTEWRHWREFLNEDLVIRNLDELAQSVEGIGSRLIKERLAGLLDRAQRCLDSLEQPLL